MDIYVHGASIGTDDWSCTVHVIRYSGVWFMDYRWLYRCPLASNGWFFGGLSWLSFRMSYGQCQAIMGAHDC